MINSPESMIAAVRRIGILPFFRCGVEGWSVEDMTARGSWWDTEGVLGPWDWKIECVRDGIAYGKFLGGKAAFATEEWYRRLMIWRRSLPKYQVGNLGGLCPAVYGAIREAGALGTKEIRSICSASNPDEKIKKSALEGSFQKLQMGTWCLIGDIQREFKGPNLEYSGWQRVSHTTPESFYSIGDDRRPSTVAEDVPFWAKAFEQDTMDMDDRPDLTPAEARSMIISHVMEFFPSADIKVLEKII